MRLTRILFFSVSLAPCTFYKGMKEASRAFTCIQYFFYTDLSYPSFSLSRLMILRWIFCLVNIGAVTIIIAKCYGLDFQRQLDVHIWYCHLWYYYQVQWACIFRRSTLVSWCHLHIINKHVSLSYPSPIPFIGGKRKL